MKTHVKIMSAAVSLALTAVAVAVALPKAFAVGLMAYGECLTRDRAGCLNQGAPIDFTALKEATEKALKKISAEHSAELAEFATKQGEMQAELLAVEQKLVKRSPSAVAHGFSGPSLGSQVEAAFRENSDMFAKTRNVTLTVKAMISSGETGSHGSLAVPNAPAPVVTQLVGMLNPGPLNGLSVLHYARRTGVIGAAAAQGDSGAAKAQSEPVFTAIAQNAITVAGYAVVSEQALKSEGGLARAVDSHLKKSVRDASDAIMVAGTAAVGWPFPGLVSLAAAFTGPATFTKLVDAILAGALRMRLRGFNPSIAVLAEADFLALQLAKDTTGRPLWDAYAAAFGLAIGGMRVALAAGVPAGKALLLDTQFCGLLASGETMVTLGYVNDQFTRNLVTIRAETQIIPFFTDYEGALLITPALA